MNPMFTNLLTMFVGVPKSEIQDFILALQRQSGISSEVQPVAAAEDQPAAADDQPAAAIEFSHTASERSKSIGNTTKYDEAIEFVLNQCIDVKGIDSRNSLYIKNVSLAQRNNITECIHLHKTLYHAILSNEFVDIGKLNRDICIAKSKILNGDIRTITSEHGCGLENWLDASIDYILKIEESIYTQKLAKYACKIAAYLVSNKILDVQNMLNCRVIDRMDPDTFAKILTKLAMKYAYWMVSLGGLSDEFNAIKNKCIMNLRESLVSNQIPEPPELIT